MDLEVIVVDDATAQPVEIPRGDSRVRLLRLDRSAGVCGARNLGLKTARGRWVVFLDDDDELLPMMVEVSRQTAMASKRPQPISVLSAIAVTNDRGTTIGFRPPISLDRGQPYFETGDVRSLHDANTLFAQTDVLRAIGGWAEGFRGWETDDLLLRLSRVSSIEAVDRVTYRMYDHNGPRLSRDAWVMIRGGERTLREHRSAFTGTPKRRALYLARLGTLYLEVGAWRRGVRALSESLSLDPWAPGALTRWISSLAGPPAYRMLRYAMRRARSIVIGRKPTNY